MPAGNPMPAVHHPVQKHCIGPRVRAHDGARTLSFFRRLLARVTQRSAQALALAPGQRVYAQVKGVAIVN